ncbi:MAG: hypothetical protein PHE88_11725 [Elusimicrobia bacterium]|nr:hypothetical protein [Elusimicrobiota bacterium]
MILDTTTRKLQVALNTTLTTANMPVVVDWIDNTSTTFYPGVTPSNTNGTTLVDILAAPAASTQRKVNGITIHNLDTAVKTVLVYLNDNGTSYQLVDAILQVSDTLGYTDSKGWYVMDSSGAIKGVGPTGATGANGANGVPGNIGMPGLDGDNGEDSFHIPGATGATGPQGLIGPQGIPGIALDGVDGEEAMPIPGPQGPTGSTGAAGTGVGGIFSTTCTQASGALTFGLDAGSIQFRQTTLTTGVPVSRSFSALSLVLPSGGTLGAVTTVQARIVLVAIDNAGTVELACINIAGGNDLSETGTINTTAISAAATANNVFYSTTARTGVAYKIVGVVDVVNTAGAWGNPTLVQGAGGNAVTAMSSLGYGQTWQNVTGSRVVGTTYYNTTGKPIYVIATSTAAFGLTFSVGGFVVVPLLNNGIWAYVVVPPGVPYLMPSTNTPIINTWYELR